MEYNIANMNIGIKVSVRGGANKLERNRFDPIIYKGDLLPCNKSRKYRTTNPLQTSVNIKVYGGDRPSVEDNLELGNFLVEITPTSSIGIGKEKVEISFYMNKNLILYIYVKTKNAERQEIRTIDTKIIQKDLQSFNTLYKDKYK